MRLLILSELLKQRSTRTNLGLLGAMVGLVVLVMALHGLELPVRMLTAEERQVGVLGQGQRFGVLFSAIYGAMSITAEFRHGTIRPTLLVTPRRARVLGAKLIVALLLGTIVGLAAAAVSAMVGTAALTLRGVPIELTTHDYALFLAGAAAGAALWAAIGVGIGAVVRNQIPVFIGLCTWVLFLEGLLFGDIGLSNIGRFLPGSLAMAATGQDPATLFEPIVALFLLALYTVAASVLGWFAFTRRDVA